jgi:hypothetical protein
MASLEAVRTPFPNLSADLEKRTQKGFTKRPMADLEKLESTYPDQTNGILLPLTSESLPKYVFESPAIASATPSSTPI